VQTLDWNYLEIIQAARRDHAAANQWVMEDTMRTKPKSRFTAIILTTSALGFVALPGAVARVAEPAIGIRLLCSNPEVVARFVAAKYPQDLIVFERALRDGACAYSGTPMPVTPVRFVSSVAAGAKAIEPVAHIWEVRFPNGKVAYTYFWKAGHEVMLNEQRPLSSSIAFPQ